MHRRPNLRAKFSCRLICKRRVSSRHTEEVTSRDVGKNLRAVPRSLCGLQLQQALDHLLGSVSLFIDS